MREVALASGHPNPETISKGEWNRARHDANRDDLPTAEAVRKRFGRSWESVLKIALGPIAERGYELGRLRTGFDPELAEVQVPPETALRHVAHMLGRTPSMAEYHVYTAAYHKRRAGVDGFLSVRLPAGGTVVMAHGSWAAALSSAGLDPHQPRRVKATRTGSRDLVEVFDLYLEEHGVVPSRPLARDYARRHAIVMTETSWVRPMAETLELLRSRRAERGKTTPQGIGRAPRRMVRALLRKEGGVVTYTHEAAVAAVRKYLDSLAPGVRPIAKGYQAWSPRVGAIAFRSFAAHNERWGDLVHEAQAQKDAA